MEIPESFGFVNKRPFLQFGQHLPLGSQTFGDLRIVHFGIVLSHFAPLTPGPDHESVHGSFDVIVIG